MIQMSTSNSASVRKPHALLAYRLATVAAAFALACFAAFVMAGCSAPEKTNEVASFDYTDITVTSEGFDVRSDGTASYAFVAVNPNEGHAASNVVFSIEGYDDKGQMIAGGGATIAMMYPGVETPADGFLELFPSANAQGSSSESPKLTQLVVKPVMDTISWFDTTITQEKMDELIDIENPKYSTSSSGDLNAAAKIVYSPEVGEELGVTNDSVEVRTVVILMDKDGRPICGGDVDTLTVDTNGEPVGYSSQIENPPKYESCHIFATPVTQLSQKAS